MFFSGIFDHIAAGTADLFSRSRVRLLSSLGICTVLLIFLGGTTFAAFAGESIIKQLQTLEKAVGVALKRIESQVMLDDHDQQDFTDADEGRIRMISLNAGICGKKISLIFHCTLCRHLQKYEQAKSILEYEIKMATVPQVKNWLQRRLQNLGNATNATASADISSQDRFSINEEFRDLVKTLKRAGVR